MSETGNSDNHLAQFVALYPEAFFPRGLAVKPLKVGISNDIPAELPARKFLSAYTSHPRYLVALQAGAARIDLTGAPAGDVTEEQAAHAVERLARQSAPTVREPRVFWERASKGQVVAVPAVAVPAVAAPAVAAPAVAAPAAEPRAPLIVVKKRRRLVKA
jgi:ProP effector